MLLLQHVVYMKYHWSDGSRTNANVVGTCSMWSDIKGLALAYHFAIHITN